MAHLRQVPEHELDVARAAAEGRHAIGAAGRGGCAVSLSNAAQKMAAPAVVGRSDAFACRLMKRSALLLFAIAVRSSIGTFRSSSRVSRTRMPRRASMAAFARRATASVRSFSFAPPAPCAPSSSPPWPGIDRDRADAERRLAERRAARSGGGCGCARRGGGAARRRRRSAPAGRRSPAASSCPTGWRRRAEAGEARTEIDGERRRRRRGGRPGPGSAATAAAAADSTRRARRRRT